jgi:hypothetical protein
MIDSTKKSKPTLASLLKECKVITGKDLIKRKEDKDKEVIWAECPLFLYQFMD